MDDLDEFDEVFEPFTKLCEKGSIETGSDEWYINFINTFFYVDSDRSCGIVFIWGSFYALGYNMNLDTISDFDKFKDKVTIAKGIINQVDNSIADMNDDIIKVDLSEFESIFKLECDPEIQQNTGRINFFTDCVKSLILCLYVKNKFDTTHEKEKMNV